MKDYSKYYIQGSDHYLIPKDEFENLLKEFEGISNDLETEDKMGDYLRCEVYRSSLINKKLQQENKILKENAEHNDKVVDKVNWENMLLKGENKQLKDNWNTLREYVGLEWYSYDNESVEFEVAKDILNKMQEIEKEK